MTSLIYWLVVMICVSVFSTIYCVTDLRTRKIPNSVTVPVFFLGIVFQIVVGALGLGIFSSASEGFWSAGGGFWGALTGLGFAASGFGVGFGILYVLWMIGGGGGGDVKLMGSLSVWLGPWWSLCLLFAATFLSALLTLLIFSSTFATGGLGKVQSKYLKKNSAKKIRKEGESLEDAEKRAKTNKRLMPFGLPVGIICWICTAIIIILVCFGPAA